MNTPDVEGAKTPDTLRASLSVEETDLLDRLLGGTATAAEGQRLYQALVSKDLPLPMEWEVHILRATVASLPDRTDLIERLAFVEEALTGADMKPNLGQRVAFERAWVRFSHADISTASAASDHPTSAERRRRAIDDACCLLSSPAFREQTVERRVGILQAIHNTLLSVPSHELPAVVELGLLRFAEMLTSAELTEPQACKAYDALHALYFAGISDVAQLARFDSIVPKFEAWLVERIGKRARSDAPLPENAPLTIAYLLHTAHFDRGNAVSPLIASLAKMHASHPNRKILLYAVQHIGAAFLETFGAHGVPVRVFPQGYDYDQIETIAESLKADGVDVVVTEQNRAIAAALYVRRVAARQMWLDTGFPFWSLKALDWTISPVAAQDRLRKTSPIRLRQTRETLRGEVDREAVARVRANFPVDAFLIGVFVRLVKLTPNYLDFLAQLVAANPRFRLIIAGPGDSRDVEAFLARPALDGRAIFEPGMVDLNVYGPAVDMMCDTFPFIGGLACREVAAHGTPVVSKLGTPWDEFLLVDRSPDLLAKSEAECISLAVRLATDRAFMARQQDIALKMAAEYSDPKQMVADVEMAISASFSRDG